MAVWSCLTDARFSRCRTEGKSAQSALAEEVQRRGDQGLAEVAMVV